MTRQSKANQFNSLEEVFSKESLAASGGILSHDTLLSRLSSLPMKALKCKPSALEERGHVNVARARGFEKTHALMNV